MAASIRDVFPVCSVGGRTGWTRTTWARSERSSPDRYRARARRRRRARPRPRCGSVGSRPANDGAGADPEDTVGVVVLDLSLSITDDDYVGIRRTLRRRWPRRPRSVSWSSPTCRTSFFLQGRRRRSSDRSSVYSWHRGSAPVQNPWTQSFRAGTRISVALDLAKSALERDEVAAGSNLLVSDLETAPDDVPSWPGRSPTSTAQAFGFGSRRSRRRAMPSACSRGSSRRTRSVALRRSLPTRGTRVREGRRRAADGAPRARRARASLASPRTSGSPVVSRSHARGMRSRAPRDPPRNLERIALGVGAVMCLALALGLGLLALDVTRSRDALAQDDVQFRISPERVGLWRAPRSSRRCRRHAHRLGGRRRARRAVRSVRLARLDDPTVSFGPRGRAPAQRRPGAARRDRRRATRTRRRSRARPGCSA